MRQWVIEFLKTLEQQFPPPDKCHHVLMYAQYGSDEQGWKDKLLLQVNNNGKFYPFFLDKEDFDKPMPVLINEIIDCLNQPNDPFWQVSDTAGKAGPIPIILNEKI